MSITTTSLPVEVWKIVPHFEDYEVSNMGHVRSNKFGRTMILKSFLVGERGNNYAAVKLFNDGAGKIIKVHHVVLGAFQGPKPDGLCVRHLNGDSRDNRLKNLAYGTYRDNYDDAVEHGTVAIGNKLSWIKVHFIRSLYSQGAYNQYELAEMFGVRQPTICRITQGKIWAEVA